MTRRRTSDRKAASPQERPFFVVVNPNVANALKRVQAKRHPFPTDVRSKYLDLPPPVSIEVEYKPQEVTDVFATIAMDAGADKATAKRLASKLRNIVDLAIVGSSPLPKPGQFVLYKDRLAHPEIADLRIDAFLRMIWGSWIESGLLTRPDLRRLDPSAEQAWTKFLRTNQAPVDLNLPTRSEVREHAALLLADSFEEAARIAHSAYTRTNRAKPKPL